MITLQKKKKKKKKKKKETMSLCQYKKINTTNISIKKKEKQTAV